MTKADLQQQLLIHHKSFNESINLLNESDFVHSKNGKWSAGQQLDHIVRSTSPVLLALQLPTFVTKLLFGKANRPSVTYEILVAKYLKRLEAGGKASGRFIPGPVLFKKRNLLTTQLSQIIQKLINTLDKFSEEDLNKFILPHPLLGKLTYREMIYFTIYHVQHHQKLLN